MDKETYRFMYPAGIASLSLVFSQKALQWLCGTTRDDDGRETVNFILFGDLLARMALTAGEGKGFRRPLTLSAGQAQYSEEQLSTLWNMGRKRIRNLLDALTDMGLIDTCRSRVASVMTFPCVRGWETADGSHTDNTFSMNRGKNKSRMADGKTAAPTKTGQRTPFLLFRSPAINGTRSVQEVADGREEWHGAIALSCEICRGITAFGRYYHDALATPRKVVVPAARRLAPSPF